MTDHNPHSPHYQRQLSAVSGVDLRTIKAYIKDPASVREVSRLRIERAIVQVSPEHGMPGLGERDGDPLDKMSCLAPFAGSHINPMGISHLGNWNGRGGPR
jgi:hypothetical protein